MPIGLHRPWQGEHHLLSMTAIQRIDSFPQDICNGHRRYFVRHILHSLSGIPQHLLRDGHAAPISASNMAARDVVPAQWSPDRLDHPSVLGVSEPAAT
jgi:hypothetical protein